MASQVFHTNLHSRARVRLKDRYSTEYFIHYYHLRQEGLPHNKAQSRAKTSLVMQYRDEYRKIVKQLKEEATNQ